MSQDKSTTKTEGVQDEDVPQTPRHAAACALRLWRAARNQRLRFAIVLVSLVLYTICAVSAPAFSARVIDALWDGAREAFARGTSFSVSWEHGGRELALYLGVWMLAFTFYTIQSLTMAGFAERLNLTLRRALAAKLHRLPLSFYDAQRPGDVVSRVTNDLDKVSEVLQTGLLRMLNALGSVLGAVIMMLVISPLLTVIFLAFSALALVLTRLLARRNRALAACRQEQVGCLSAAVEEAYSGRVVIRSFCQERVSTQQVGELADALADASMRADFFTNATGPAVRFINRLAQVTVAVVGCWMLVSSKLSVGVFQAFFQYTNQAGEPLTQVSVTWNTLQGALAAAERVFALLDEPEMEPDAVPSPDAQPTRPLRGEVRFEQVCFGYNPAKPLMRGVNLTVHPGQKVAVVGATGAGKTTLINLLMRFYEVQGGRIVLDGVDTHAMRRKDLRSCFGMVLQDAWLFEGTVAQNIAYGRPDATREEIIEAARAAEVDFFIRTLPQGYDTPLANDAENISVGQRQLLTIARVLLTNPDILILDEATSSVDTRTEQDIVAAMERLMVGRTSFVIAHRLSTVVDADLIVVMAAGTIVESGTHTELLAANGSYAELYRSQFM